MVKRNVPVFIVFVSILFLFNKSSATSSKIVAGVRQFQIYINNNLPSQYLGTPLSTDGVCRNSTKIAAVKLVQYKLNLIYGTKLDVNGEFDSSTQLVFEENECTIKKNSSGFWAYVLQGLLYCNNYDPNGFDGSYGVGGGTGCLDAVNSFKYDNSIDEYPNPLSGEVGVVTMAHLCWNTYQVEHVEDGIYLIQNINRKLYLQVEAGGKTDYTNVCLGEIEDFCLSQFWKVKYLGGGYYSIRPLHKLSMALDCTSKKADVYSIGIEDNNKGVPSYAKWRISKCDNGYLIINCNTNNYLTSEDESVCVIPLEDDFNKVWVFECVEDHIDRDNTVLNLEDSIEIITLDTFSSMLILMLFGLI